MLTAVDSSVLLDVITDARSHAAASERGLRKAASEGGLIIGECVLAEIRPAFASKAETEEFLGDWQLRFIPSSRESALLAGELFELHLKRGGKGGRVLADFLIGAHAVAHADRLLARDRGYLRDYFKQLKLLTPA
ncbi:MAG: PIN domain-containing protein [Verrucomicrobiota bacterium]|nr:PIN domain-containing protein [Verrucomicrobiota bacterium]